MSTLSDPGAAIDKLVEPFNRGDAPGLVIGVAREGRVVYRRALGLASVQHGVANTPATRMRIGSTTKHFACLAAMLLHEEGRLDVDAPASAVLPELPALQGVPTLRQYMNHTSGHRCSLELAVIGNGLAAMPAGWQPRRLFAQQGVNFAPGHGQIYCNGGYHLLSLAIDRAAGMPFERFLRERVLEPLDLRDTAPMPDDAACLPGVATNHLPDPAGGWRVGAFGTGEIRAEGSLVSTVDDMLRWMAHLRRPTVVGSAETWRQMLEPAVLANGLRTIYGLGLYRQDHRGLEVVHHAGGVIGGNSQMLTVPSRAIDIAIMVNGAAVNATELGWQVLDALLPGELGAPVAQLLKYDGFEHLEGTRYHGPSGTLVGFGKLGELLGISINGTPLLPLLRERGDRVGAGFDHVALGPLEIVRTDLQRGAAEAPSALTWHDGGNAEQLQRVDGQPGQASARGGPLQGRYHAHDAAAEATVAFEDEQIVLTLRGDYSGPRRFRVDAYSADAFALADLGMPGNGYALTVRRREGGAVQRFELDTPRVRHLAFDRVP